jgi:hypothetical protein
MVQIVTSLNGDDIRSNRPFGIKHFQTIHRCGCRYHSQARASLRNRHQGPSSMGFEDEVEQSLRRPHRKTNDRSKRTCELTSSIVPRGTSFHHSVEIEFPPIAFDPARFSRRFNFLGPPELGAVNPDAVHDHRQPGPVAAFSARSKEMATTTAALS